LISSQAAAVQGLLRSNANSPEGKTEEKAVNGRKCEEGKEEERWNRKKGNRREVIVIGEGCKIGIHFWYPRNLTLNSGLRRF